MTVKDGFLPNESLGISLPATSSTKKKVTSYSEESIDKIHFSAYNEGSNRVRRLW